MLLGFVMTYMMVCPVQKQSTTIASAIPERKAHGMSGGMTRPAFPSGV